jgi:hypothetical protein
LHTQTTAHRQATRWLLAVLGSIAITLVSVPASRAETVEDNPNNYQCQGHIEAGKPEAGNEEQQVAYTFACDGPISGYQLQSNVPVTAFSSNPDVSNIKGEPLTDTFSCSGEFPGWAVNCVGSTKAAYETISGQFSIGSALCAEPRVDPLLSVTYASGTGTYTKATNSVAVTVTQAISGPFDLGRPHGCPPSAQSGGNRLNPKEVKTVSHTKKKKHAKKGSKKGTKKKQAAGK